MASSSYLQGVTSRPRPGIKTKKFKPRKYATPITDSARNEVLAICDAIFPTFVGALKACFSHTIDASDTHRSLQTIMAHLREQHGIERFICPPLIFIRQHISLLRNYTPARPNMKLTEKEIRNCLFFLADLVVALDMCRYYGRFDTTDALDAAHKLYVAHHAFTTQHFPHSTLPNAHIPLRSSEFPASMHFTCAPEPMVRNGPIGHIGDVTVVSSISTCPQGETLAWYQQHGHESFLQDKRIVPLHEVAVIPGHIVEWRDTSVLVATITGGKQWWATHVRIHWQNAD